MWAGLVASKTEAVPGLTIDSGQNPMGTRTGNNLSESEPISVQEEAGLWFCRGNALGGDGQHDSTVPVDWKLPPFRQGINLLIDPRGSIVATSEPNFELLHKQTNEPTDAGRTIRPQAAAEQASFGGTLNAPRSSESVNREEKQLPTEPPVRSPGAEFASFVHSSCGARSWATGWTARTKEEVVVVMMMTAVILTAATGQTGMQWGGLRRRSCYCFCNEAALLAASWLSCYTFGARACRRSQRGRC